MMSLLPIRFSNLSGTLTDPLFFHFVSRGCRRMWVWEGCGEDHRGSFIIAKGLRRTRRGALIRLSVTDSLVQEDVWIATAKSLNAYTEVGDETERVMRKIAGIVQA